MNPKGGPVQIDTDHDVSDVFGLREGSLKGRTFGV